MPIPWPLASTLDICFYAVFVNRPHFNAKNLHSVVHAASGQAISVYTRDSFTCHPPSQHLTLRKLGCVLFFRTRSTPTFLVYTGLFLAFSIACHDAPSSPRPLSTANSSKAPGHFAVKLSIVTDCLESQIGAALTIRGPTEANCHAFVTTHVVVRPCVEGCFQIDALARTCRLDRASVALLCNSGRLLCKANPLSSCYESDVYPTSDFPSAGSESADQVPRGHQMPLHSTNFALY